MPKNNRFETIDFQQINRAFVAREQQLKEELQAEQQKFSQFVTDQERLVHELEMLKRAADENGAEIERYKRMMAAREDEFRNAEETLLKSFSDREEVLVQQLRTGNEDSSRLLQEKDEREAALATQIQEREKELQRLKQSWSEQEKALTQKLAQLKEQQRQEHEGLLNIQLQREQEFGQQLLAVQKAAEQAHREYEQALRAENVVREGVLVVQLHEKEKDLQRLEERWSEQQKALTQELAQLKEQQRKEQVVLLNAQLQREQEFGQQLLVLQQAAEQARREYEQTLRAENVVREGALVEQLREKEKDLQRLEESWSEQQKALTQELAQLKEQQRQEHESLLSAQAQREQEFVVKLLDLQKEAEEKLERSLADKAARESLYNKKSAESRLQIETMLHIVMQHEQELAKLKERQRQECDALLHVQVQREQEFTAQLLAQQQGAEGKQERFLVEHARELSSLQEKHLSEISRRHDELQAAEHARQLQSEQFNRDLAVREAEYHQQLQLLNSIAIKLNGQLQGEREALARIRTSLLWRMSTPLRALASIFLPSPSSDPSPQLFEQQYLADINRLLAGNPHIANVHSELREFTVPSPIEPDTVTTVAATLDELLTLHDRAFVQCAYLTVLGRAADPDGLQYYVGRLRQGISKIQVLVQLRKSAEGKKHSSNLPELDAAIKRYQSTQTPLMRWLTKLINSIFHNAETSAQMRRIESQLLILNRESSRRFKQIDSSLGGEHHVNPQAVTATLAAEPHPSDIVQTAEPEGLKNLSPHAREIYFQLKKTTATVDTGRAS